MSNSDYLSKENRRHERGGSPVIFVTFEGATYSAVNWSLGGFLIEGYEGKLTSGALFNVIEIGTDDGKMNPVEIRARVVRVDPAIKQLVVSFLDIDDTAFGLLQGYMAQRMVGLRIQ